mgnify:CR=1 FL=1
MKKIVPFLFVPVLALTSCLKTHDDKYKDLIKPGKVNIILITGQSNASGNSPWEYLESKNPTIYNKFKDGNTKVLTSYYVQDRKNYEYFAPTSFGMADHKSLFGPEIGIADTFLESEETTYIIKFAVGATRIFNDWLDGKGNRGKLYNDSVDWFKKRLNYLKANGVEPTIVGQFWMQGEGDSTDEWGSVYASNLKNMISFYREDLKDYYNDHYTFVDAYISTKTVWPNPTLVNQQKQMVADADPNVFCIKTNGEDETALNLDVKCHSEEGNDAAHYDSVSEVLLGQRAGQIIRENIQK